MRKLFALLPALLLSGCVSGSSEPQLKEIAPQTLGLSAAAGPQVGDDWWKSFKDPQVDRLAAMLVEKNPTLAAAMARIRSAEAQVAVAGAATEPQLNIDGQEQRDLLSKDYIIPPPYGGTWRWFGQTEATLTWDLDFWGKQADLIAQAKDTHEAAALDAAGAKLALSGAFAQSYINLYLAYANSDIADATVTERQQILDLTANRVTAGLENQSAVEQARALLALAKVDQQNYAAQRELEAHAIAALVGEGAALYPTIVRPTADLDAALPLPEALPADLLSRRPDILAARARVDAAAKGREAAHADFYPNINLSAFAGFQAVGLSNLISGNAFTTGVGPAFHLPVFDAGKIRGQYAGATAGLDVAVADYNGAVVNAIKQAADAMTQVKNLTAARANQQAALDSATRAFALAQERYKDGLSNQLPMLTAEATLLEARQRMAALLAMTATERVTLLLSVGGAFDPASTTIAKQE